MPAFGNLSIRVKLILISVVATNAALLVASAALGLYDRVTFRAAEARELSMLAGAIGTQGAAALASGDSASARRILAGILSVQQNVVAACIYSRNNRVLATYVRGSHEDERWPPAAEADGSRFESNGLVVFRRVVLDGKPVGTVYLHSDLSEMYERRKRYIAVLGLVALGSSFVAFLLSSRLQRTVSGPIRSLAETAKSLTVEKNYSIRAAQQGEDETGQLVQGFNEMLAEIERRDVALERAHEELERRVEERTRELQQQVAQRERVEEALQEAEEKYHGIFREAVVGIFQTSPDGRYLAVNPTMAKMYGYDSPEELISSRTDIAEQTYVDPDRRKEFKRLMEERGVAENFEYQVYRKDGSKIWLMENARAVRDAEGRLAYYVGAVEDVSERKWIGEALQQSERELRAILEALPVAVRIVQEGKVVFANEADARLYGYKDPAQEIGVDAFSFVAEEDSERLKGYAEQRAAGREAPRRYEALCRTREGRVFPVDVVAERLIHAGAPASLMVVRDLTERRRLEIFERILPVCCVCGKIRDDAGVEPGMGPWEGLDEYVIRRSDTQFSHTFCPDCYEAYRRKAGLS